MSNRIFVPTSFVWHIHNPGVSSAPSQDRVLWWLFLPTTGSFFVCITDFALATALFSGRLSVAICFRPYRALSSLTSWLLLYRCWNQMSRVLPFTALCALDSWFQQRYTNHEVQPLRCLQHLFLWSSDIIYHLCSIIISSCCKNLICDPQKLTCHCNKRLLLF